jgi:hypothetical protein
MCLLQWCNSSCGTAINSWDRDTLPLLQVYFRAGRHKQAYSIVIVARQQYKQLSITRKWPSRGTPSDRQSGVDFINANLYRCINKL